ncbi:MAG: cysteine-rich CWC family protein [Burkholderiales bacterium]|nr:cysteine-rich CWC family protein [Burkholderiales bacterium]
MAPDDSRCPRCGGAFHCGVHDPAPCACTDIRLDPAQLISLRARYAGCLCPACLRALAAGASIDPAERQPPPSGAAPQAPAARCSRRPRAANPYTPSAPGIPAPIGDGSAAAADLRCSASAQAHAEEPRPQPQLEAP